MKFQMIFRLGGSASGLDGVTVVVTMSSSMDGCSKRDVEVGEESLLVQWTVSTARESRVFKDLLALRLDTLHFRGGGILQMMWKE